MIVFFIGAAVIAFPTYSYNTMMDTFPLLDITGSLPVWSVYIYPASTTAAYMHCVLMPSSKFDSNAMVHSGSFLGYVDLANILCWFNCPFTVAVDFDKCFSTACSVMPGQDEKFPSLIAFIHVDFTGLNAVACR
jgi:hypothetical protein